MVPIQPVVLADSVQARPCSTRKGAVCRGPRQPLTVCDKSLTLSRCLGTPPSRASRVALVVKDPPASAGDIRDMGSIPGSGRPPGGGHGSPLQSSRLENPMDRGAWRATVHGVAECWT